jgi:hypothetical protein
MKAEKETQMTKLAGVLGFVCAAGAFSCGAAAQTVVYDTLSITDNGLYNRAFGDCIGVPPDQFDPFDLQLADDFALESQTMITRVTADFVSSITAQLPDAVWVQFFADVDGAPSNDVTGELIAVGHPAITVTDLGPLNTPAPNNNGVRLSIDVSSAGITLGPGTWWVSVQPVQLEVPGWYWILRQLNVVVGNDCFARNGGTHHMGEYGGFQGVLIEDYNDWARMGDIGLQTSTVPMRIEGSSSACRADFNADGEANSQDFFDFLNAFFSSAPSSDFNSDGVTNSQDFFDFLTIFFQGC